MRHRYETRGIVLSRSPLGEANALVTLITPGLGLVRARAQGVRQSGAKLAPALTTFTESSLVLMRGKEGWRIAGAVLEERWLPKLEQKSARESAARIAGLLVRLVAGEAHDPELFSIARHFFVALTTFPEDVYESIEILAALRVLAALGLDAGDIPGTASDFSPATLTLISASRSEYIARINRGIEASGL